MSEIHFVGKTWYEDLTLQIPTCSARVTSSCQCAIARSGTEAFSFQLINPFRIEKIQLFTHNFWHWVPLMICSTQCPQFHPLCSNARQTNFAYDHMETTNPLTWMWALNGALEPNYNEWTDLRVINLPSRYRLCCFDSDEMRSTYIVSSFGSNHSLSQLYVQEVFVSVCRRGALWLWYWKPPL